LTRSPLLSSAISPSPPPRARTLDLFCLCDKKVETCRAEQFLSNLRGKSVQSYRPSADIAKDSKNDEFAHSSWISSTIPTRSATRSR
jgi:hypothetical protein